ncbi:MAG TPA: hypothetical protein PKY77_22135 [Phycisphaerae bacterium]|nr:hypothetical protein [Phycisphaerae bacterium]
MTRRRDAAASSPRFEGLGGLAVARHGRQAQRVYLDALARLIAADFAHGNGDGPRSGDSTTDGVLLAAPRSPQRPEP